MKKVNTPKRAKISKTTVVDEINHCKNKKEIKDTIIGLLKSERITTDDLLDKIKAQEIRHTNEMLGSILADVGLLYSKGTEGFGKNNAVAFKLYLFASELGNKIASRNCAFYYHDGRAKAASIDGKDFDAAEEYCIKSLEDDISKCSKSHVLLINIYIAKNDCHSAIRQIGIVKDQLKPEHEDWKAARECEKKCLILLLKQQYEKLVQPNQEAPLAMKEEEQKENAEIGASLVEQEEEQEKQEEQIELLPGFQLLSAELEGFDERKLDKLSNKVTFVESQLDDIANSVDNLEKQKSLARSMEEEELCLSLDEKLTVSEKEKKDLQEKLEGIQQAYADYVDTDKIVLRRQYQAELRFFDPRRTVKEATFKLAKEFKIRRLHEGAINQPIKVSNIPTRRLITAERSTVELGIDLYGHPSYSSSKRGWAVNPASQRPSARDPQDFTFDEQVELGNTLIQYRQKITAHHNHPGDFYMPDDAPVKLGDYADIVRKLERITERDAMKEQALAGLMIDFCKNGIPTTLQKLKEINDSVTGQEVDQFNQILYHCFVKEIASWMLARDKTHQLPYASTQARALWLLKEGYLSIRELFKQYADYGIFTDKYIGINIDKVVKKMQAINLLYDKAILEHTPEHFKHYIGFIKKAPKGRIIPTKKHFRKELQTTFGAESDTDGGGYSSDEDQKSLHEKIKL